MFISHRINYLDTAAVNIFNECDGIEFDIRDSKGQIIVQHDAFKEGQLFSDFVKHCPTNKFYIVNVKSEGIEYDAIKILEEHNIYNFFLLDCSIPMIIKLGKSGETRIAARFSEYESIYNIKALRKYIQWVWVDVFTIIPITYDIFKTIKNLNLKICLVSPELQGQNDKLNKYIEYLKDNKIQLDAVCLKQFNRSSWMQNSSVLSPCPN